MKIQELELKDQESRQIITKLKESVKFNEDSTLDQKYSQILVLLSAISNGESNSDLDEIRLKLQGSKLESDSLKHNENVKQLKETNATYLKQISLIQQKLDAYDDAFLQRYVNPTESKLEELAVVYG